MTGVDPASGSSGGPARKVVIGLPLCLYFLGLISQNLASVPIFLYRSRTKHGPENSNRGLHLGIGARSGVFTRRSRSLQPGLYIILVRCWPGVSGGFSCSDAVGKRR